MIVLRHENTFEALPQRTIMSWMLLPFRESVIAMLLLEDDLWMLITPPIVAQTTSPVKTSRTQNHRWPIGVDGPPVPAQKWHPVGDAVGSIRLLWDDWLTAFA